MKNHFWFAEPSSPESSGERCKSVSILFIPSKRSEISRKKTWSRRLGAAPWSFYRSRKLDAKNNSWQFVLLDITISAEITHKKRECCTAKPFAETVDGGFCVPAEKLVSRARKKSFLPNRLFSNGMERIWKLLTASMWRWRPRKASHADGAGDRIDTRHNGNSLTGRSTLNQDGNGIFTTSKLHTVMTRVPLHKRGEQKRYRAP